MRDEVRQVMRDARDGIREGIREGLRDQDGTQAVVVQPPPRQRNDIPPEVIPLVAIVMVMVVAMVVGHPIARAIGRVIERRGERGMLKAADVAPQIRQLQESVDTMAIEIERISEAQRFQAKLMAERAGALGAGSSEPR